MASGFDNVPPVAQQITDNLIEGNIGGIISTRPQAKYMSGARCILRVNSQVVAFAFQVSWRIQTLYTEINTVDNILPEEFGPRAIKVDGSISALHIPGQGVGVQLWQPDVLAFMFAQYITIEVRDSTTNELLFFTPKAVITSRQEDIGVDDLAQVQLSFQAIGFKDEKEPGIPDGAQSIGKQSSVGDLLTNPLSIVNSVSGFKP